MRRSVHHNLLLLVAVLAGTLALLACPAWTGQAQALRTSGLVKQPAGNRVYLLPKLSVNYNSTHYGAVSGVIIDATTGDLQSGAKVCVASTICDFSRADGTFFLSDIPTTSPQTLTVTPSNVGSLYANFTQTIQTSNTTPLYLVISLSPANLPSGWVRIVLSWSIRGDLDAHLWWRQVSLPTKHVYYASRGSCDVNGYACLQNDSSSLGPETITVRPGLSGIISYAVARNGEMEITQFNAVVQVYDDTGLIKSYNGPSSGVGAVWYVFDMTWNTTTSQYDISLRNQILFGLPY